MRVLALIVSAGLGTRFKSNIPKQFIEVFGKPLIFYTLKVFEDSEVIDDILLVVPQNYIEYSKNLVEKFKLNKVKWIIPGGEKRQDSVFCGLKFLMNNNIVPDILTIHDGVRPLISKDLIKESVEKAKKFGAVVLAVPAVDTIKIVKDNFVQSTLNRKILWCAQTPQTFKYEIIKRAYIEAYSKNFYTTDDSSLVEKAGFPVYIICGAYKNIKITTEVDLELFKILLKNDKSRHWI